MDSCDDTPKGWVAPFGHPRINACSRLPVAFRSVPRPSSPPGAKASTECPSLRSRSHHPESIRRLPPCTETILSDQRSIPVTAPQRTRIPRIADHSRSAHNQSHPIVNTTPLNPPARRDAPSRERIRSDIATQQRPETHQNLIHPDKDHRASNRDATRHRTAHRRTDAILDMTSTRTDQCRSAIGFSRDTPASEQIHCASRATSAHANRGMEVIGLEPTTPCLQSRCSPS